MNQHLASGAELASRLVDLVHSSWITHAIDCGLQLGVFDALAEGPRPVAALATELDCAAQSLRRLLCALASLELCAACDGDAFELQPMGRLLCKDQEGSLRAWSELWCDSLAQLWSRLTPSVRSGRSARHGSSGQAGFEHIEGDARLAGVFNDAMTANTYWVAQTFAARMSMEGVRSIVDVGGGQGALLAAVLARHPTMRGIVFDLPHAADGARALLSRDIPDGRGEVCSGSFFETVPQADAHLLKSVLHDWSDDACARILDRCRAAAAQGGRLFVIERLIDGMPQARAADRAWARSDLNMLLAHGARERTREEYEKMLTAAGYAVDRVVELAMGYAAMAATARA